MDITVSKSELNKALQVAQSAISRKTTMPILVNILLKAEGGQLRILASDLDLTVLAHVKAEIHKKGATAVNAKVFCDIIKELPEGQIKITQTEGERIEIQTQSSKFRVIGQCAEEYPEIEGLDVKIDGKIQAKLLSDMIGKTLYATSLDEARYNLTGVCFEITAASAVASPKIVRGKDKGAEAKELRLVATDGHRLSMITRPVSQLDFEGKVIVPRRGLVEVKKILDAEGEKEVSISISGGFFMLETDSFRLAMRLIDGEYPDYSQVIPKEKGSIAEIKGSSFAGALRRVVLMATDQEKCAKITFEPGSMRISSQSPEIGDANEALEINYSGESFTVGFNARYLTDIVSAYGEGTTVVAEMHGELGPGKFSPENDESCIAVVMPMRL